MKNLNLNYKGTWATTLLIKKEILRSLGKDLVRKRVKKIVSLKLVRKE